MDQLRPQDILRAWNLDHARIEEVRSGHINRTWRIVSHGVSYALQWLNPIFDPVLHLDIDAVTSRLHQMGLITPRLVPTTSGELWFDDKKTGVWRMFSWIDGETFLNTDSVKICGEAGRLLGLFHSALWDFEHEFSFTRLGVHDTEKHISNLKRVMQKHADHPKFSEVNDVAKKILDELAILDLPLSSGPRIVHGDPKLSNIVFSSKGRAVCMVDLDTLARMPIAVELGDALRSWCNPAGEEHQPCFRMDLFRSAIKGYAQAMRDKASEQDWQPIPKWTGIISLELAARFCADALEESYFRWDESLFASASEHNLLRAKVQLDLARSIARHKDLMEKTNRDIWLGK